MIYFNIFTSDHIQGDNKNMSCVVSVNTRYKKLKNSLLILSVLMLEILKFNAVLDNNIVSAQNFFRTLFFLPPSEWRLLFFSLDWASLQNFAWSLYF
jgi:hypothetical protein